MDIIRGEKEGRRGRKKGDGENKTKNGRTRQVGLWAKKKNPGAPGGKGQRKVRVSIRGKHEYGKGGKVHSPTCEKSGRGRSIDWH